MSLSDDFHELIAEAEEHPERLREAAALVLEAPETAETNGLLALMYHEGIGVATDLDKACALAEKAAFEGGDPLGYFLLGYMCDNIETPDQAKGGDRQRYDHYDAERFYEICAGKESRWQAPARMWLGDYYMDMARGGDPEIAVEHYEAIAERWPQAAYALCDYYWGMHAACPDDEEVARNVYRWTLAAVTENPHDYSYHMGCVHAEGIGCNVALRLARKYWEDAYAFGDSRASAALAALESRMKR